MNRPATVASFAAWELEAFAEGVEMPHIQKFVQDHPDLWANWLHSYQQAQRPYATLARFDCPTPQQLQGYYWQQLPRAERQRIAAHLPICTSCTQEMQSLISFLADETVAVAPQTPPLRPQLTLGTRVQEFAERVRTLVASFVPPLLPELAPVAFRDGEIIPALHGDKPATLLFTAEEIDISLVALKETDGQLFLSGQVLTGDEVVAGKVKLTPAGPQLPTVAARLDETGAFVINNLAPGYYHLAVTVGERSVVVPNVLLQA